MTCDRGATTPKNIEAAVASGSEESTRMSDGIGLFEAAVASVDESERQQRIASDKLAAATYDVKDRFGEFLFAARDVNDFRDRVALCRDDMVKTVEPHLFPRTGIMRRITKSLERELAAKLAGSHSFAWGGEEVSPYTGQAAKPSRRKVNPDDKSDYAPTEPYWPEPEAPKKHRAEAAKELDPKGDFKGYLDSVDEGAPSKVDVNFTGEGTEHNMDPAKTLFDKAAAHFAAWCRTANVRPSLSTLDHYAARGLSDEAYMQIASALQRRADSINWDTVPGGIGNSAHAETDMGADPSPQPGWSAGAAPVGGGDLGGGWGGKTSGRRTAAPDYLQKADESLTNLLNQRAEEFQQAIAPLQQALQVVQQAEAEQQAANPFNVMPGGSINPMPGAQGGAPAGGGDPMAGGGMPPGGGDPSMGGMDPSMMGGDPSMGGMPPGGDPMGGGMPPQDPNQQMMARRRRTARPASSIEGLAHEYGMEPHELQDYADMNHHPSHTPLHEKDEAFIRDLLDRSSGGVYEAKRGGHPKGEARKGRPAKTAGGIEQEFQNWQQKRPGLPTGTEADIDQFLQNKPVGPRAKKKLKTKIIGPQSVMASRKQALDYQAADAPNTHKVAGWEWDDYLNAHVASAPRDFSCSCGKKFAASSGFQRCACGKQWNSYVIGTGGDRHEASAEKYLVREIPVRDNVIVAKTKSVGKSPSGGQLAAKEACGDAVDEDNLSEEVKEKRTDDGKKESSRDFAQFVADAYVARESAITKLTDPGEITETEEAGTPTMKSQPADWARRNADGKFNMGPRKALG